MSIYNPDDASALSTRGSLILPHINERRAMLDSPRWALTRRKLARGASAINRAELRQLGTGADLDPKAFTKQMRSLGVQLNAKELGMLFCAFDNDGDGTVAAREFAAHLADVKGKEKVQRQKHAKEDNSYFLERKQQRELQVRAKHERLSHVHVAETWSDEERDRGLRKLETAAGAWSPPPKGPSLDSFADGGPLTPSQFWQQLRFVFNVHLDSAELAAVMAFFANEEGLVDGCEFASRFFRLSAELRSARFDEERRSREQRQRRRKDVEDQIHERFFAKDEDTYVPEEYTEADEASALGKLAKIARGALSGAAAPDLAPFKGGASMDATALKHYLRVCLRITLVPAELAALMGVLDQSGTGLVDASEFLNCFHKVVRIETRRRREEEGAALQRKEDKEARLIRRLRDKADKVGAVSVSWPSIEEVEEYATRSAMCTVSSDVGAFLDELDEEWPAETAKRKRKTVRRKRRTRGAIREERSTQS